MKLRDFVSGELKKFSPRRFESMQNNHKFPSFKRNDISERISKMQTIIGIDKKLKCELLSDRTVLINQL